MGKLEKMKLNKSRKLRYIIPLNCGLWVVGFSRRRKFFPCAEEVVDFHVATTQQTMNNFAALMNQSNKSYQITTAIIYISTISSK